MSGPRDRIFDTLHDLESWLGQMEIRMEESVRAAADIAARIDHLGRMMDINAQKAINEQERIGRRDDPLIAYLDERRRSG